MGEDKQAVLDEVSAIAGYVNGILLDSGNKSLAVKLLGNISYFSHIITPQFHIKDDNRYPITMERSSVMTL